MVFNTCAVTGEAVRQARQAIRKARRERPGARLVVTGCAAQIDPAAFAAMPEVDLVLGQRREGRARARCRRRAMQVGDIFAATPPHLSPPGRGWGWGQTGSASPYLAPTPLSSLSPQPRPQVRAERARAYVEVQNGCDHRCTFCIIPFGRGNSRSIPAERVVAEVRGLARAGYAEVVLTGVDLTSWGARPARRAAAGRAGARGSWPRSPNCRACASPRSTRPRSTPS